MVDLISILFNIVGAILLAIPMLKGGKNLDDDLITDRGVDDNGMPKYTTRGDLKNKKYTYWGLGFLIVGILLQFVYTKF